MGIALRTFSIAVIVLGTGANVLIIPAVMSGKQMQRGGDREVSLKYIRYVVEAV